MNTKKFKTGIALVMLMSLFTVTTNAQSSDKKQGGEKPSFEKLLKEMDANEDGKLSKDEVKGPLKDDFATIDTDEDGFISKEELENAPKPRRERPEKR